MGIAQPRRTLSLARQIGKESALESLAFAIQLARERDEPLGHVLLSGPVAMRKAALAGEIARRLGTRVRYASVTEVRDASGIVNLLACLSRHDVLYVEQIHKLLSPVGATLHTALIDFRLTLVLTSGKEVRRVVLPLAPFTLVGATSHPGLLPRAFLDIFKHLEHVSSPAERFMAEQGSASPARSRSA